MRGAKIELVVFDLAGTTVTDNGFVQRAFEKAVETLGLRVGPEEIRARMGQGKLSVFRELAARDHARAEAEAMARLGLKVFEDECARSLRAGEVTPMYGAVETFAYLHAHGVRVATTTGFERATNDALLKKFGWRDRHVDAAVCASDVRQGRPAPFMIFRAMELLGVADVASVVKVGDTPADLLEGVNAGATGVVGVLSGSGTEAALRAQPHTHIIESVADFPVMFARDFLRPRSRDSLELVVGH